MEPVTVAAVQAAGNAAIIGPGGEVLAGPLTGEEGILYAQIDTAAARANRQQFDPAGHYSRPDIFQLHVDTSPRPPVIETGRDAVAGNTDAAISAATITE